ncbi:hypothetical protein KUV80_12125 [Fictibacillus nanhaiensis]|uniref:immunoglobulin-like domain-containing protein n=1 Tax=Fictibacillus nanhaiensis TaxID=742169 RepID=UPI001C9565D9|nr:immunoglobulin-like domain-containing protein [Fictibacillus nanhaiensis]MBY6037411.1 hypothetical protein [Fictibacillus nanhaiensis]
MKYMKLFVMASLLVLLAACGSKPVPEEDIKNGAPQVENDIPAEEAGVKAEVKLEEASDEAQFILRNGSEQEVGTGTAYSLEKWNDGKWEKVNSDQMFTEQMILVKAGENYEQKIDLKDQDAGTYRVTKSFFENEKKYVVASVLDKK